MFKNYRIRTLFIYFITMISVYNIYGQEIKTETFNYYRKQGVFADCSFSNCTYFDHPGDLISYSSYSPTSSDTRNARYIFNHPNFTNNKIKKIILELGIRKFNSGGQTSPKMNIRAPKSNCNNNIPWSGSVDKEDLYFCNLYGNIVYQNGISTNNISTTNYSLLIYDENSSGLTNQTLNYFDSNSNSLTLSFTPVTGEIEIVSARLRITYIDTSVPDTPSISASSNSTSSVNLNWTNISNASSYKVYNCNNQLITTTSNTSYTVTGLNSGTTYSYKVKAFNANGGSNFSNCASATTSWPIIINNNITGNQTITFGESTSIINGSTPNGGSGNFNYSWQKRTTGNWITLNNSNSKNYNPGALTETSRFRRRVSSGGRTSYSNEVTITVNYPAISNNMISGAQSVNLGDNANPLNGSLPNGGNNNYSYQWQKRTTGNWITLSNSNSRNYTPNNLIETTEFRRNVFSANRTSTSNNITVIVNLPSISNNRIVGNQTINENETPENLKGTYPGGGNGNYTYQWQKNDTPSQWQRTDNRYWVDIENSNTVIYQPPSLSKTTRYRRKVISGNTSSISNSITVEVIPFSDINNNIIFLNNGTINGSTPNEGTGIYTYQWIVGTNTTANTSEIPGATSKDYTIPKQYIHSTTIYWFRRIVRSGNFTSYSNWIPSCTKCKSTPILKSNNLDITENTNSRSINLISSIKQYPNPSIESINFDISLNNAAKVKILLFSLDLSINKVIHDDYIYTKKTIIHNIPKSYRTGIYGYKVFINNLEYKNGTIIIKK
ncbi:hypothetical protein T190611E02C_30473 [Tenacibaculum sp. 190524A05c]|uniref:fibronectin type III domain-containing protein n=1 Tax=Tenacibaculum platacis TaxID=3137852 RepID=UPI0031FAD269